MNILQIIYVLYTYDDKYRRLCLSDDGCL